MKTNKYLITAVLLIFSLDVLAQKLTSEYFTTVDKLFEIELGMSPEGVSAKLGIEPFDFHQNLDMGELILEYRYQHKFIKEKSSKILYASNMNQGEVYYDKPSSIFMIFDKSRKLTSYYTDAGESNVESAYKWEKTLLLYNKNVDCDGCHILSPPEDSEKKINSIDKIERISQPDKDAQKAAIDRIEKEEGDAKAAKERQKAEAKKAKEDVIKQKAEVKKAKAAKERQKAESKKAAKAKAKADEKAAKAKAKADEKAAKAKAKADKKAAKEKTEAKKAPKEKTEAKKAPKEKTEAKKAPKVTNNSEEEVYPPRPSKRNYKTTNEYNKAVRTYYKEKEKWEKENEE